MGSSSSAALAGALLGGLASGWRRSTASRGPRGAAARGLRQVDEEQLALQQELDAWGDEDEEPGRIESEKAVPRKTTLRDESDWRYWAQKVDKQTVWAVLTSKHTRDDLQDMLMALRRGDVLTSKQEYERALSLLAQKRLQEANILLQCMWFNGFKPDHRHYLQVMKGLRRAQRWKKIVQLIEEMLEHEITPCMKCYELAIDAYGRKCEPEGVLQLFKACKEHHGHALEGAYHRVMAFLAKDGSYVKVLQLFEEMVEQDISPTLETFNHLVMAYGMAGELEQVLDTMDHMEDLGVAPNTATFIYGMRAAERSGDIDGGLLLFQKMKQRGLKTNERVDEALMRICLAGNDPDRALQFFDAALQRRQNWGRASEQPVQRELKIYQEALHACEVAAASGQTPPSGIASYEDYALQLLLELQKAELELESTVYLHALTTCEYAKSWKRVIYLLKDMKERKIKVEPARFRSAFWNGILTAEMEQDVEEAFDLFQQMKENKLYVEDFMYEKVIRILERGGQLARATAVDQEFRDMQMGQYNKELKIHRSRNEWQEAIGVLDAIRADGLTPTLNVTNSAMSALQKPGKWELVLTLMSEMRWEGNLPDFCSHTVAISAMLSAGELARAVKHLEEMQQQGIEPTALTYGRVIFALEANGHPEMALHLWDQMRRKEIEPDRVGYEAAIRACHRCEYWEAVLELFGEMQEKDKFASKVSRQSAAVAAERLGLASSVTEGATLTA